MGGDKENRGILRGFSMAAMAGLKKKMDLTGILGIRYNGVRVIGYERED
jgi:hypothetical protein